MAGDLTVATLTTATLSGGGSDITASDVIIMDNNTALLTSANSALPANVSINTKYTLVNPFGANTPVEAIAEIQMNDGNWGESNVMVYGSFTASGGTKAGYVAGVGIIVQTANTYVARSTVAGYNCDVNADTTSALTSAPCRVRVTRIGGN